MAEPPTRVRRGTTNRNVRGSSTDRRRRREWLVQTYGSNGRVLCWRGCGAWLTVDTLTVDRLVPGCRGGTYRRENIRPACAPCNTSWGSGERRA
jgi:hypothetical protein